MMSGKCTSSNKLEKLLHLVGDLFEMYWVLSISSSPSLLW